MEKDHEDLAGCGQLRKTRRTQQQQGTKTAETLKETVKREEVENQVREENRPMKA